MKIHFRKVDGTKVIFAELADGFFCRFDEAGCDKDLPGIPMVWGDFPAKLGKELREKYFLDVIAETADCQGTVRLHLPDPVTLMQRTMPTDWDKARERVKGEVLGRKEFQVIAHWWEYLRRSESFRRDCEDLRGIIADNIDLQFFAIRKLFNPFTFLMDRFRHRPFGRQVFSFFQTWGLPLSREYPFLYPDAITSEDLVALGLLLTKELEVVIDELLPKKYYAHKTWPPGLYANKEFNFMDFVFICRFEDISDISAALLCSPLKVENFFYVKHYLPNSPLALVSFYIDLEKMTIGKVLRYVSEALGNHVPAVRTWNDRRRLDPLAFRRELAALDGRTDLDLELWPGKTGKALSKLKSRARSNARKRIQRLEAAAEERRQNFPKEVLDAELRGFFSRADD